MVTTAVSRCLQSKSLIFFFAAAEHGFCFCATLHCLRITFSAHSSPKIFGAGIFNMYNVSHESGVPKH